MDQFGYFVQTKLFGSFSKYKEHGIDDIGFSGSVRSNDGGEAFVERSNGFDPRVGFEVFKDHFGDDEPWRRRRVKVGTGCGGVVVIVRKRRSRRISRYRCRVVSTW